jgi:hypothetical protein
MFRMDMTEVLKVITDELRSMETDQPLDDEEFDRRVDEAARRGVEPPRT